ncbi:hypothetical protein [Streptomyces sp. NRRL WC-3742]|uniref:hypothetical protein n=1 Tax=Streptomyces sp. NRRL WC-3742 TaxID=1463934 RepID=UPI00068DE2C1|nr:hypothetical protein [Streptomyces sp. NRRL WC-3742]
MSIDLRLEPAEEEILEGELLDDDDPGPRPAEPDPAGPRPWWRRQLGHIPAGLRVLAAERSAWLFVTEDHLSDRAVALHILNDRHQVWEQGRNAEHTALAGRAAQEMAAAKASGAAAQAQGITPAGHTAARRAELAARTAAAQWEQKAAAVLALTYTGHAPVLPGEITHHRRRMSHRRRIRLALTVLGTYGIPALSGGPHTLAVECAATGAAVALAAWGKSVLPRWRSGRRADPDLAYKLPDGGQVTAPAGPQCADNQAAAPGGAAAPAPAASAAGAWPTGDGRPFPIHGVTDPVAAAECVRRALLAERVPLAHVGEPVRHPWGWEVVVRVFDGTSGDIGDKLGGLETKFDVGDGDVILQPNRKRTAEAVLRIVTGDLFGAMQPPPYRAPHSVDITDAGVFGMSADGTDLSFSLAELMGEVIARSGGGKSTLIRALLDWTTAADNAVTVFLDPSGDGPGKFSEAVKLTSTNPIEIEFALLSLYRLAAGRARIRRKLGMGDTWRCTREHPAIIVFVDEFPKLTKRSKQIIAELMLVGRKEGVWLIFAAQGATKELLGSNIAQHPALKILGACRDVDTTGALGGGAIDWGFLPHRLQPKSGDSLNDLAKTYIVGAPGVSEDPMLHKWHYIPDDEGGRRAAERLAAGLVDVDQASIHAALHAPNPPGLKFADEDEYLHYVPWPELLEMCAEDDDEYGPDDGAEEEEAPVPEISAVLMEAFDKEEADALTLTQLHRHLIEYDSERWDRWHHKDEHGLLMEIGRHLALEFRKVGIKLSTERLDELDGSPRGIRLASLLAAVKAASEDTE